MVDVPGLTTRQNNFLVVGGGPKKIFFFFINKSIFKHADLKRKKIFFWAPPHREKIILSRRQPWYINHLKI